MFESLPNVTERNVRLGEPMRNLLPLAALLELDLKLVKPEMQHGTKVRSQ